MQKSQVSLIVVALTSLILAGCSSVKPLEVRVSPVNTVPLVLPAVDPIILDNVEWYVINKENAESVFLELEKKNYDEVLFGLTDKGYENITVNMAKILAVTQQQGLIIGAYQKYHAEQGAIIRDHNKEQSKSVANKKKEGKKTDGGLSFFKRLLPWGSQ